PVRYLPVPPCLLVQLRGVFLDPAVDRGVIDRHAPLGHHFLQIAVAHPVAAVPPHCPQNDVTGEVTTGEDTHGCDYFTSLFLLPRLCNSTQQRMLEAAATAIQMLEHEMLTGRGNQAPLFLPEPDRSVDPGRPPQIAAAPNP